MTGVGGPFPAPWLRPNSSARHLSVMPISTEFRLDETIALLARAPATYNALLRGLPEAWVRRNEGEGTWSAYDIVGHLVSLERTDWMARLRHILAQGDSRAFDRVDRFAQMKEGSGQALEQRLDDFARLRRENLSQLQAMNLQPADFERKGLHPALGPVTLQNLLATWTLHDLTHLHQLSRVMAYQYSQAVGPWVKFMGVLQCDGHSAPA